MNKLLLLIALIQFSFGYSATYNVGPTRTFTTPNELYKANILQNGDTVEIDATTYTGTDALAVWSQDNLTIKGIGGRPHLIANGKYIHQKGIWVIKGENITVDNIEFSGAIVPDKNGAGIRLDATGITVRNCYFHDNENGILGGREGGTLLIEYSEFANNGHGDGYSHNLYIGHADELTFRYNYTHHCNIGQTLKSRANKNYILYNRIMDEETGIASRLIDLSNGGFAVIIGNIMMQGPQATNNNMMGYGAEGLKNIGPHQLYFINNTLVNKRKASCRFLDIQSGAAHIQVDNNIFAGTGTVINTNADQMNHNIIETDISKMLFKDEANFDYNLLENSPAIDTGKTIPPIEGMSLTPEYSYTHTANKTNRIIFDQAIDAGAYEWVPPLSIKTKSISQPKILFNKNTQTLTVSPIAAVNQISIYSILGQKVYEISHNNQMNLSSLKPGIYVATVTYNNGTTVTKKLITNNQD